MGAEGRPVVIDYTNYRGERRERLVHPKGIWYGESPHHAHEGEQWFLTAFDVEKGKYRDFAMKDIHSWRRPS